MAESLDPGLVDYLSGKRASPIELEVYRATRRGLNPTAASSAGGRWMVKDGPSVLYTALTREGALAEISYHLGLLTPVPRRPVSLSRLSVSAQRAITLRFEDFEALGIDRSRFSDLNYTRCQAVGAVVAYLNFDAFIVPSARWPGDNLVILTDAISLDQSPELKAIEEVDWADWAARHPATGI